MKKVKRIVLKNLCLVLVAICFLMLLSCAAKKSEGKSKSKGKLAASVDDIPIYKKDVEAGLPKDATRPILDEARTVRLDRLIYIAMLNRFLEKNGITIQKEIVDKEIVELRKTPPAAGCSCCRYASLEQFMELNYFTMQDLRELVRIQKGLDLYVEKLWEKEHPNEESVAALVREKRAELEKDYLKVSHIFFNCFQDPAFQKDPDGVIAKKQKLADKAFARLKDGDKFEDVVNDMSEDMMTRNNGGSLGCIPESLFGPDFKKATLELKSGEYSKPVTSPWGIHIIRRDAITDNDLIDILKSNFTEEKTQATTEDICNKAKVVKME